jgi:hypothetical protein
MGGGARIAAKLGAMPEDCSCTVDFAPVKLTGLMMLLGCGGCGGFALSMTADLDRMIEMLTAMRDTRDQGNPVVHPGGKVASISSR